MFLVHDILYVTGNLYDIDNKSISSPCNFAIDVAKQTWESQGVRTTTFNQLVSELVHNWATEEGQHVLPILFEEIMSKVGQFV